MIEMWIYNLIICSSNDDLVSTKYLKIRDVQNIPIRIDANIHQQIEWSECGASPQSRCQWRCKHKPRKAHHLNFVHFHQDLTSSPLSSSMSTHWPIMWLPLFLPSWFTMLAMSIPFLRRDSNAFCKRLLRVCYCQRYPPCLYVLPGAPGTCRFPPQGTWTLLC